MSGGFSNGIWMSMIFGNDTWYAHVTYIPREAWFFKRTSAPDGMVGWWMSHPTTVLFWGLWSFCIWRITLHRVGWSHQISRLSDEFQVNISWLGYLVTLLQGYKKNKRSLYSYALQYVVGRSWPGEIPLFFLSTFLKLFFFVKCSSQMYFGWARWNFYWSYRLSVFSHQRCASLFSSLNFRSHAWNAPLFL